MLTPFVEARLQHDLIDPEEFPFTEDEIYRAQRLFFSEAESREFAASVAQGGRENRLARLAAKAAIARGSRDLEEVNYPTLVLSTVFFAQLAAVSSELETRVERYRAALRDESRVHRLRNTAYRLGYPPGQSPPATEVVAVIAAEDAADDEAWFALRTDVASELESRRGTPDA